MALESDVSGLMTSSKSIVVFQFNYLIIQHRTAVATSHWETENQTMPLHYSKFKTQRERPVVCARSVLELKFFSVSWFTLVLFVIRDSPNCGIRLRSYFESSCFRRETCDGVLDLHYGKYEYL